VRLRSSSVDVPHLWAGISVFFFLCFFLFCWGFVICRASGWGASLRSNFLAEKKFIGGEKLPL